MKKKPLVIIAGPTASGKTASSVLLAQKIGGEIISADSMQVYRHMDIGSAKIFPEEMCGIPHHLIDILEPTEDFNVVEFQKRAKDAMDIIYSHNKIPILVGGTGFYIQSVLYDIDFNENNSDDAYRKELENIAITQGYEALYFRLKEVDPASAQDIHPHNIKRMIRALEYYHQTGERISEHNDIQKQKSSPYQNAFFVLNMERDLLYRRIDKRVDIMLEKGLVTEVKRLKDMGIQRGVTSMQGLGYKEILDYLDGKCSLEEAVYLIKRDTRHFAKRQLTWFRREPEVEWINYQPDKDTAEELVKRMTNVLIEKKIIR